LAETGGIDRIDNPSVQLNATLTDDREVAVEVPKSPVQRKSESIHEGLREVIAFDLTKSAALGTFPTVLERVPEFYDEAPPNWYSDRPAVMDERACDYEENPTRAWRIASESEG
jgi:hypothetical protein